MASPQIKEEDHPLQYSSSKVSWATSDFIERRPNGFYGVFIGLSGFLILAGLILSVVLKGVETITIQGQWLSSGQVELQIQPSNYFKIKSGMRVLLSVVELPEAQFGNLRGKVESLSSVKTTSDHHHPDYYAARVLIQSPPPEQSRIMQELRPGMSLKGAIILRQESYLKLGLKKLFPTLEDIRTGQD